jgi:hypothetical protein
MQEIDTPDYVIFAACIKICVLDIEIRRVKGTLRGS